VYSVDLPQIHELGHYRPISNTVLYDDKGREFGSFALQRRIIAQYDDFPKVLYDAVLSIEDKNFEKHSGFEPPIPRKRSGRFYLDNATSA
jgi:penicillin-binding protein 1A